jgi:type IV secretory pathway VirJ component
MKRIVQLSVLLFFLVHYSSASQVDTLEYGAFGKVVIYQPEKVPDAFMVFISGDGGWNSGVVNMAGYAVNKGAFVAGIDIRHYLKSIRSINSNCYYPAGDLEDISMTIQKKYKFNQYLKPILVGYSSGATLVYGALAQAPANTFKGAISLGFCPDIEIDRPLCKGSGLTSHVLKKGNSFYLEACKTLTSPFIALNGTIDQICNYTDTKEFIESMPMAELISLPNVGHGFSVTRNWVPQFISAYQKIVKEPGFMEKKAAENSLLQLQSESLLTSDLPLAILPSAIKNDLPLALFISGDGGWTSFDHSICEKLAEKGMPVVGLDAQKYFWNEKTPAGTANDLTVAINHYMQLWNKKTFVLIGYSFGACVAPFIAENFSSELKETLKGVYCFSPDLTGDFEIHISDMLHLKTKDKYDVPAALRQITKLKPVCIFGNEEGEAIRKSFNSDEIRIEILPGNHHYNNDYNTITEVILKDFQHTK